MKKSVAFVAVAGLFASACGGLSEDEQAFADAFTEDFKDEIGDSADGIIEDKDFECYGEKIIKEIGIERLEELDVTVDNVSSLEFNDDLTEEEDAIPLEAGLDCIGGEKLLNSVLISQGIEDEDAECLAKEMDADKLFKNILKSESEEDLEELEKLEEEATENAEEAADKCEVDSPF